MVSIDVIREYKITFNSAELADLKQDLVFLTEFHKNNTDNQKTRICSAVLSLLEGINSSVN